jgi:hypothetical protein
MKMQTVMNSIVVKKRIRNVVKIRKKKVVKMIVGKKVQAKKL